VHRDARMSTVLYYGKRAAPVAANVSRHKDPSCKKELNPCSFL